MRPLFRVVSRFAPLAALAGGAVLLVGDSSECPDGYATLRLKATFTSSCPTAIVPAAGAFEIATAETATVTGVDAAVRAADQGMADEQCVYRGATLAFTSSSSAARYECGTIRLDAKTQDVTCTLNALPARSAELSVSSEPDAAASDASSDARTSDAAAHDAAAGDAEVPDAEAHDAATAHDAAAPPADAAPPPVKAPPAKAAPLDPAFGWPTECKLRVNRS